MPLVTVLVRPRGAPSATTGSPICTELDVPSAIGGSGLGTVTLTTPTSVCGSRPVMDAGAVVPSLNSTLIVPPFAAGAITWLLVKIWPSLRMTSPDPLTPAAPLVTRMVTTDGNTFSATTVALHAVEAESETEVDGSLPPLEQAAVLAATTRATVAAHHLLRLRPLDPRSPSTM